MAIRKKVNKAVDKKVFKKTAQRTQKKNLSHGQMMRGGFHF